VILAAHDPMVPVELTQVRTESGSFMSAAARLAGACDDTSMTGWLATALTGRRVLVREPAEGDVPALVALMVDPDVRCFLGGPLSYIDAQHAAAAKVTQPGWGRFVIVENGSGLVVGSGDLDRKRGADQPMEVSYQLHPDVWGRGLAREALHLVVTWFFTHTDQDRLIAVTQTANQRSRRLLERTGAVPTITFAQYGALQQQYEFPAEQFRSPP
jgi:RimJ/RimL family protein N-acetyltransferase